MPIHPATCRTCVPTMKLHPTLNLSHVLAAAPPLLAVTAAAVLALHGAPAAAQGTSKAPAAAPASPDFLALGVALLPEFEGSSERSALPAVLGRITLGATSLRLRGAGLQWNVLDGGSPWALGLVAKLRGARDEDVEDEVVRRLRPIDASAGLGVFAEYTWRSFTSPDDSLTAGFEMTGGENGGLLQLNLAYGWQAGGRWRFSLGSEVALASRTYQGTYFGVDADDAQRSGLPAYLAGSGVYSTALSLSATYSVSRDWLLIGRVQAARLTGDAADSPIVTQRGSRNQSSVALALGRRF
jgi:MipA family protein